MSEEAGGTHRSDVIEHAVNVEWLMSALISQHYMKHVDTNLVLQVLYDEYFSFALKRRIVEKIVDMTPQQVQSLNRLNTIRNYFAHCSQQFAKAGAPDDLFVPDPRQPDKEVDFDALYDEFMGLLPGVETFLLDAFKARGGVVRDEMPR
jgi:hypothetical protein